MKIVIDIRKGENVNYNFKQSGAVTYKNGKVYYEEFPVNNPYLYRPGDTSKRYPQDMSFPSGTYRPKRRVKKGRKK